MHNFLYLFLAKVNGIKEQILSDSSYLQKYENKLEHILNCLFLYILKLLCFRLYMIRYNEDPCLNLNGPECKF